ncbi:MAG: hypothetical protein E6R07_14090 [Nevskiaceae bacterium]|nr:MAG: hypothetical protein E6R07_14090 [Nevskiaceae bacterium]
MSVELPPPATPQQGTVDQLQSQAGSGVVVAFQTYQLHVAASGILDEAAIQNAVGLADNLSNAVRNIGAAAYLAGYPASQVTYALSGNDLYVLVLPGKISGVKASDALKPYLNGLESADPMRDSDLIGHTTLASLAADRAGIDVYPVFEPDGNGGQVLDFEKNNKDADPTTVRVEFGNPGNRFASRYFLDMDLKTGSIWGDEFRVFAREGIQNLDDKGKPGDYHEQDLVWTRVTPWGLFGLDGRFVNYNYTSPVVAPATTGTNVLGRIWVGEAQWLYPLFANFNSRWTVQAKADRTSKSGKLDSSAGSPSQEYQRELYTSGELGTTYLRNFAFLGHRWDLASGVSVRKGFGDRTPDTSFNPAAGDTSPMHGDEGYLLFRPTASLKFYWTGALVTGVEASGQFSNDSVPEQQQWVLGGLGNLTSSLPGVAVGDKGYLARAYTELTLPLIAGIELKPRVLIEHGAAKFAKPLAGQSTDTQQVTDAGLELGFKFTQIVDGTLAYAKSFDDKGVTSSTKQDADARVYFRISIKL